MSNDVLTEYQKSIYEMADMVNDMPPLQEALSSETHPGLKNMDKRLRRLMRDFVKEFESARRDSEDI